MTDTVQETPSISPDLLAILRDPLAVQEPEKYGADPGKLELVHNCWLVSHDTGYKYPIRDGIPVMLIDEGARWKDTPVDKLPVPPEPPAPMAESSSPLPTLSSDESPNPLFYVALAAIGLVVIFALMRLIAGRRAK